MSYALRLASGASVKLPVGLLLGALLSIAALLVSSSSLSMPWERAPLSWPALTSHGTAAPAWRVSSGEGPGFQASFTPGGVLVVPENGAGATWRVALTAYGYDGAMQSVNSTAARVNGQAVEYQRGALTEWYKNTPLGLEQGFTLSEPPTASVLGASPLRIELSTSGSLYGSLSESGDAVTFTSPDGATVLRYDGLHVFDANGATLPSWMTYESSRLSLFVNDSRATYPIVIDPIIATETKLTASDASVNQSFGQAAAIDGTNIIVGAWGDDQRGADAGAAYVFANSGTWTQRAKLTASDGVANDYFGYSVAISGTVAVVGAPGRGDRGVWAGAAYVFGWNGASWVQQAKLLASDGQQYDQFGRAVAIQGNTIVVGAVGQNSATGAAYIYRYSSGVWTQNARLVASDASTGDSFGSSVAIAEGTVVVGAQGRASNQGAAYVFTGSGSSWSQEAVLTASDGASGDLFGGAVSISGNTVIAGAAYASVGALANLGAAYVFGNTGGVWSQQAKLLPTDGVAADNFGFSVSVDGDSALVGSVGNDALGVNAGAVYLFVRNGGDWPQEGKITPSDGRTGDEFGRSAAIQGSVAVVGAHIADTPTLADTGAAYVYEFQVVSNLPPSANAGGPYTVRSGASITLTGTASDPNNDPLTYAWDLDNDGGFETPGKNVTFSAVGALGTLGVHPVAFQACDSRICDASATTVTVTTNNAPSANAGGPYTVPEGATVTLTGSGSDPEGDAVTFQWDLNDNGIFETPLVPSPTATTAPFPPSEVTEVGEHTVNLQVCDIYGACTVASTVVTITNVAPTVSAGGPYTVAIGYSVTLTGSASDPGGNLAIAWDLDNDGSFETPGLSAVFNAVGPMGTPGAYPVALRACDSYGVCTTSATIVNVVVNRPPTANAGGPYSVVEGATTTLTGSGSDPDGDPLTYAWDLDNNGSFEASGQTAVFPPAGVYGVGPHVVKLQVCDLRGSCTVAQATVTITPLPAKAYAVLGIGKESVRIGTKATVSGGLVGGNGNADLLSRSRVRHVLAGRNVSVGTKATTGNITAGGKVKVHKDAVTGTIVENASVPVVTLPAVNANPDKKKDIKRSQRDVKAGPLDLTPGRYGSLDSASGDRIILHGGEYHFSSFSVDAKSKITVDLSNGQPLIVRISGNLRLGINTQMEVLGGSASDIAFLVGGKEAWLRSAGTYLGTFMAPHGKVTLGVNATLNGSIWARRAQTLLGSTIAWAAFTRADLLGPAQALEARVADVDDADWEKDGDDD